MNNYQRVQNGYVNNTGNTNINNQNVSSGVMQLNNYRKPESGLDRFGNSGNKTLVNSERMLYNNVNNNMVG